jgi:hypothetical protein
MNEIIILTKKELFKFIDDRPAINKYKFAEACGLSQSVLARRATAKRDTNLILKKEVMELYGYKK